MNPKDLVGAKKAPLRYVPQALVLEAAAVMATGAAKYGPFNWREQPVSAVTYAEAIQRHLAAWVEGQDNAEDSGLNHIAHIAASCGILLDAAANGTLLDDRTAGPAADILRRLDRSASPAPVGPSSQDALDAYVEGVVKPTVTFAGHELSSPEWVTGTLNLRGTLPPETELRGPDGILLCCLASEHVIECPRWR